MTHYAEIVWTDRWQAYGTVWGAVATVVAILAALGTSIWSYRAAKRADRDQAESIRGQQRREFLLGLLFRVQDAAANLTGTTREIKTGPSGQKLKGLLAAIPPAELPITRFCFAGGDEAQIQTWARVARDRGVESPTWDLVMGEIGALIGRISGANDMTEWT